MIIHISTYDNKGGSGKSAYRIHNGLKKNGFKSKILTKFKTTNDIDVELISNKFVFFLIKFVTKFKICLVSMIFFIFQHFF